jgi:hypothetical protein
MGIGASVFLIAVGGILTFATDVDLAGVELDVVGIILMVAGAIGLFVSLVIWGPRRRSTAVVERPVVEERRVRDDGPTL